MIDVQGPFSSLRPVKLDAVESELDKMWREANTSVAATGGQAYARNSVLTLVAFTSGQTEAQRVINIVHGLTTQHPSRAIVIQAEPTQQGNAIAAYVGTQVGANAASYGEDIAIEAQSQAVRHLPGVVLPLIAASLPSFLWWTGNPPWGSELLEALVDGCDRVIVDTSEMAHPERSLAALEDVIRRKKARCAISDINWTVQAPWREIVAQFFDAPTMRPYLENIERITIEYAAGDEYARGEQGAQLNTSQGLIFAGWLISRLGWRVDRTPHGTADANRQYSLHNAQGRPISFELNARFGVPQQSWWNSPEANTVSQDGSKPGSDATQPHAHVAHTAVRPGALMSVHLTSRLNGQIATFVVAREADLQHATTICQVPGGATPSQTVHLDSIGEASALAEQLQALGHDQVYEETMVSVSYLAGAVGRRGAQ